MTKGGAYLQQYNNAGNDYKTNFDILMYSRYNAARTAEMNLPANIGGSAFTDSVGRHTYVLWAKTTLDVSEAAAAVYSFPPSMNVAPIMDKREWDWTVTNVASSTP